jgi:hypothetical protein
MAMASTALDSNGTQKIRSALTAVYALQLQTAMQRQRSGVPRSFRTAHPIGWTIWKGEVIAPTEEELLTGIQG